MTKRQSQKLKQLPLNPEEHALKTFLDTALPADQLEYLINEKKRLIFSNLKLQESNKELEAYPDDRDLVIAMEENLDVIIRQKQKLDAIQQMINDLEEGMAKCSSSAVESSSGEEAVKPMKPEEGVYL